MIGHLGKVHAAQPPGERSSGASCLAHQIRGRMLQTRQARKLQA
jgi:hypothetical protein